MMPPDDGSRPVVGDLLLPVGPRTRGNKQAQRFMAAQDRAIDVRNTNAGDVAPRWGDVVTGLAQLPHHRSDRRRTLAIELLALENLARLAHIVQTRNNRVRPLTRGRIIRRDSRRDQIFEPGPKPPIPDHQCRGRRIQQVAQERILPIGAVQFSPQAAVGGAGADDRCGGTRVVVAHVDSLHRRSSSADRKADPHRAAAGCTLSTIEPRHTHPRRYFTY